MAVGGKFHAKKVSRIKKAAKTKLAKANV